VAIAALLPSSESPSFEPTLSAARTAFAAAPTAAAAAEGRALLIEDAVAESIVPVTEPEEVPITACDGPTPSVPAPGDAPDLTRREREARPLICRRLTDLEIAQALFVSPRTASNHVANVLSKLGAANRREAAATAARLGLA
jgi:DNA-binding NarL/FixJ family response regulator